MQSLVMQSVVMQSVIMQSVVMLNVAAPQKGIIFHTEKKNDPSLINFVSLSLTLRQSKLERLSLTNIFSQVYWLIWVYPCAPHFVEPTLKAGLHFGDFRSKLVYFEAQKIFSTF